MPENVRSRPLALVFAARLTTRFGARPVLVTGLAVVTDALVLLARVPADGSYGVDLLPALVLLAATVVAATVLRRRPVPEIEQRQLCATAR
ncbi:hypothetical protein [Amycolatopsis sp. H20-H5]|uniref:hypothetical protein n=1 Tax=Amycolatopsis sp. H20-H5 TaxID=3046309 RepID=UPI002DB94F6A|nr:hypothetical protein [Amycolatopsis sp. H20-H5]MEC3974079.1 hypothetical protein [Amycolatopsis sp. H20-H5]